jgi:hypothetical protein
MTFQTNQSHLSAANPTHGFNHLDHDGDAVMDLTPIPELSLGNTNAYGDSSNSPCPTAWQELGSNDLSSTSQIYDATYSSDMLNSQFLPQSQMEVPWENSTS